MNNISAYRRYRLQKGLKVAEVAKMLDISVSHLWNIENGNRKPGKDVILKMCSLYSVSLEEIFFAS